MLQKSFRQYFCTAAVETKFQYSRLSHYQLLEVTTTATLPQMKKSYLKLAKKYHPDVYNGINVDHFKRVLEAFNTLKNPISRKDYDKKMAIINRTRSTTYSSSEEEFDETQFVDKEGNFDAEKYQQYKRRKSKVRREVDPDFVEELKKHNFGKMFREFQQRPMRTMPEEMEVMKSELERKMSRRDLARQKYV